MNNYFLWIRVSSVLQILTAGIHAIGLFKTRVPDNDTERTLYELMITYRPESLGPHFHPTTADIFMALSACFSFLYLLAGMINFY